MGWRMSTLRDVSHYNTISNYGDFRENAESVQIKITEATDFVDSAAQYHHDNCFGMFRAPYHFARPVSLSGQISHFLRTKEQIGTWERLDMLDCEFSGITGAFIFALKEEYRKQSGISQVQIYIGLHDIVTSCPPNQWWDEDVFIQVARYRKIGPPNDPDAWHTHLGFDHIGLSTYQWDNATPLYPGGPLGDVSFDRIAVGGNSMAISDDDARKVWGFGYEGLRNIFGDAAAQNPAGGYSDQIRGALRAMLGIDTMQAQLAALVVAHADGDHDLESILARMETIQRQAIFDAIQQIAVPSLSGTLKEFITQGTIDEEIGEAVVRAFAQRLDQPAPQIANGHGTEM